MRCGVDWVMPGTMIGDGGLFRGTAFVTASTLRGARELAEARLRRDFSGRMIITGVYPVADDWRAPVSLGEPTP